MRPKSSNRHLSSATLIALLLSCCHMAPGASADKEVEIRLVRSARVAETYGVHVALRHTQRMAVIDGDTEVRSTNTESSLVFDARVTVRAINTNGMVTKASFSDVSLTRTTEGTITQLLPSTAAVVAFVGDDGVGFTHNGTVVDHSLHESLISVFHLPKGMRWSDNEIFDPKGRKVIGSVWSLHPDIVSRNMAVMGMRLMPESVSGTGTLLRLDDRNGVQHLVVAGEMRVSSMELSSAPDLDQQATATLKMTVALPVKNDMGESEYSRTMTMDCTMRRKRDRAANSRATHTTAERSVSASFSYE